MYIVLTVFAPKDNNFSCGGLAFKVGITKVGYVRKVKWQGKVSVYNLWDPTTIAYSSDITTKVGDDIFVLLKITGLTTNKKGKWKFCFLTSGRESIWES